MALTNRVWSKRALSISAAMLLAAALVVPASLPVGSAASATVDDPATPGTSVELKSSEQSLQPASDAAAAGDNGEVQNDAEKIDAGEEPDSNAAAQGADHPGATDPTSAGGGGGSEDSPEVTDGPSEDSATKPKDEAVPKQKLNPLKNRGPLFDALKADAPTIVQPLQGAMATVVPFSSLAADSLLNIPSVNRNTNLAYLRAGETLLLVVKKRAITTLDWEIIHPSGERESYQFPKQQGVGGINWTDYKVATMTVSPKFASGETDGIVQINFDSGMAGRSGQNFWYLPFTAVIPNSLPTMVGQYSYADATDLYDGRIQGRVATPQTNINQNHEDGRDVRFWPLLQSGHIYEVLARNWMGGFATIDTTSSGVRDPDIEDRCISKYRSVYHWWEDYESPYKPCGTPYLQFYERPDSTMAATATLDGAKVRLLPPTLMRAELENVPVQWEPESTANLPFRGNLNWKLPESYLGTYLLQVDANGNGSYGDSVDVSLPFSANFGSSDVEFAFDGKDALGKSIPAKADVTARLHFATLGEVHFTIDDGEVMEGITITRLNGNDPDSMLFWNDSELTPLPAGAVVPAPLDGSMGVNSDVPGGVHGWTTTINDWAMSWGENRYIDNWAYEPLNASAKVKPLMLPPEIQVQKQSSYDQVTGKVTYTVNVRNDGLGYFDEDTVAGIGLLARDQTKGVLDDAVFNNDLAVTSANPDVKGSYDPATGYVKVFLDKGASFGPGETATVKYSVTVKPDQAGDATLLNYAEAGTYDDDTFGCTDDDGKLILMVGSSSEWSKCSWTTDLVPVLSIEKSADKTGLYGLNDVATYKVKVTNHGPGVLNGFNFGGTNGVNPVMTDDLSKVTDDAQLVWTDIGGTVPTNRFYEDNHKLYWHGTLAVGETRTLSYQAKVVKNKVEDYELNNTACLANNIVLAKDADRCSSVDITRAGLAMSKTVDPEPEMLVTYGEELTYTLTFHNPGKAAAKVDTIDILDGLLDDAVVNHDWVVKDGTITVTPDITGQTGKLILKGTVPAGNTATITYTATVMSEEDHEGDRDLVNMLLASPDITPDCEEDGVFCVWNPLAVTPHLPFTGTDGLMRLLVLGGGAVVVLLVVARRLTKRAG
ncbi:DUF7927 domain-containing protein [Leucobacter sp. USHLN153]|uniref:DUF7927 domain-containing protein n=1 Tax=Leucobacter sp. USHLN153 TaxID=3081268 RepID=UPI00301A86DF